MKTKSVLVVLAWLASALAGSAAVNKPFPAHWGPPPRIETRDLVPLPEGYGTGSSTMKRWIEQNLAKDAAGPKTPAPSGPDLPQVYAQDFQNLAPGKLPESEFLILAGDFIAAQADGGRFLELPGDPLDTFGVMMGPPLVPGDAAVAARCFGTAKARRQPTFGIGIGGASPWKLVVAPGKGALELWRDDQFKASSPWQWKSGTWTSLKLELRKLKDGEWQLSGKAWDNAASEPADWTVRCTTSEKPPVGRASLWGSPFAGTPIRFDDLVVRGTAGK